MKAQAALEAAQAALVDLRLRNKEAEANATLAAAEKQKADVEKTSFQKKMTKHCDEALKKAQAALEAAQALVDLQNKEAETAEKQKADAEKKRADMVLFEISGTTGLVCRCRIPTAAVAQRGLFRILLGSGASPQISVSNISAKENANTAEPVGHLTGDGLNWHYANIEYCVGGTCWTEPTHDGGLTS